MLDELERGSLVVRGVVEFGVVVTAWGEKDPSLTAKLAVFGGKMVYVPLLEAISMSACCVQTVRGQRKEAHRSLSSFAGET